jgi:hypothetical protein
VADQVECAAVERAKERQLSWLVEESALTTIRPVPDDNRTTGTRREHRG